MTRHAIGAVAEVTAAIEVIASLLRSSGQLAQHFQAEIADRNSAFLASLIPGAGTAAWWATPSATLTTAFVGHVNDLAGFTVPANELTDSRPRT